MKVIGITGGVGSGKSEVLGILKRDFGAELLIADEIAHQVMEPGMPASPAGLMEALERISFQRMEALTERLWQSGCLATGRPLER